MKPIIIFLLITAFSLSGNAQKMKAIFNGKNLNNWDISIGTALNGFDNLKESASPDHVYSIVKKDGDSFIRISGDVNAAIATKEIFENYHLRLEFKWGEQVYTTRNSGLLYHSYGPFGAGIDTWMSSIECQLMHDNLGDAYMMANTLTEVQVTQDGDNQVFSQNGQKMAFGNDMEGGKIARKNRGNEKPIGEWNVIDLYCFGQQSIHVINGKKVMECNNNQKNISGKITPLVKGKIQIQSEGAELFIRSIEVRNITSIPDTF